MGKNSAARPVRSLIAGIDIAPGQVVALQRAETVFLTNTISRKDFLTEMALNPKNRFLPAFPGTIVVFIHRAFFPGNAGAAPIAIQRDIARALSGTLSRAKSRVLRCALRSIKNSSAFLTFDFKTCPHGLVSAFNRAVRVLVVPTVGILPAF